MKAISKTLLQNHLLVRNRYRNEEYLIDQRTYEYLMDFIHLNHQSIYELPDDEMIEADKLLSNRITTHCHVRINELIFE
ncbi:hypothetical protein [Marinoscillum sp. MHG1-6]|uniref:hypothetical protein n=1 Tax=Marinoscillum sp. MHG1-6 TaxID=2959627 RepID=UPI002158657E|nr:hypothetical protein [Marinoscillum sp. MHG1-6]